MRNLDEWTLDNLPSFGASALGILGGIVVVAMLAGGGAIGLLAGLILGPFPGWGAAILLHQLLVAGPMRGEDERRSEEFQARQRRIAEKRAESHRGREEESARRRRIIYGMTPQERKEYYERRFGVKKRETPAKAEEKREG